MSFPANVDPEEVYKASREHIAECTWSIIKGAKDSDTLCYDGKSKDWSFAVVSFNIEVQGFPPGSRGYDGVVINGQTVVRMTREFAEELFNTVDKEMKSNS